MDEAWLDTVRLARDCGDISSLFPPGITKLYDLPHTIHSAIRMALYYLSFEKLDEDETPPKWIWMDKDRMDQWWRDVKRRREDKYNPTRVDTSGMTENALVNDMLVGSHG